jgi:hypothetical protein
MTEFWTHLALAADHTARAIAALVPPRPRAHLKVIGSELIALVNEFVDPEPDDPATISAAPRSRRIDIEE